MNEFDIADFQRWFMSPTLGVENKDGIWWHQAPLPRRWHRCKPWTSGEMFFEHFDRCACGSLRKGGPGNPWSRKNTRRRQARRRTSNGTPRRT